MKRCPQCQHTYTDETVKFCRQDGTLLIGDSVSSDTDSTLRLPSIHQSVDPRTQTLPFTSSIAVLPFVHMSADSDNEYFCDGLAEELLNALTRIGDLKVAARTSAFSFKGKNVDISEIGRTLHVQTVLEGSVRKSGKRLRITVQLVNVSDGYHLWSERYDCEMNDIFDVQDEITLAVVEALKVKLLGEKKSEVLQRYTDNAEVYDLYLKGRYSYFHKYSPEGWLEGLEFFNQAIEKEPDYALAYAGKARALGTCYHNGLISSHEAIPPMKAAISRALELDKNLVEAHTAQATLHFYHDWNWAAAEREFRKAIELNPNNPDARQGYGVFLFSRNRFDQAISEIRKAIELDPLSIQVRFNAGFLYWFGQRLDEAMVQVDKMIELEPRFFGAYWLLGAIYWSQDRHDDAIEAYQKSLKLNFNQLVFGGIGSIYGTLGKRGEALGVINQLLEMKKHQNVNAFNLVRVYGGLGDIDKTLEWLERALEERNSMLVFLEREIEIGTMAPLREMIKDTRVEGSLRHEGLIS
jgi:adenylate cyclase